MLRTRRAFTVLLSCGILLPGVILAVFGLRSLNQEQLLAERQTHDALQSAADIAAREIARELNRWPEWEEPAAATFTFASPNVVQSARGLLWLPTVAPQPLLGADAEHAEEAEIRHQDYKNALVLYNRALDQAAPGLQPVLLLRIARTSKKAGDEEAARRNWLRILTLPVSAETAAARFALVESGRATANDFYRDLISGIFPLDREQYFFYSTSLKAMLDLSSWRRFQQVESSRRALTEAAEAFVEQPKRLPTPGFVAFWNEQRALLIPEESLRGRLTTIGQAGLDPAIHLRTRDHVNEHNFAFVRRLDDQQLPWVLEAFPRDAARHQRSVRNKQNLYLGALSAVLVALLSGVFLTARTLQREAEFSRLQSDFVATVSHEFRSPLTGIRQLAELLDSGVTTAEHKRKEYYASILQQTDRLTQLVENLLDLSRLEAGKKQYRMESIHTSPWLNAALSTIRSARLRAEIPANLPPVHGDRQALTSALTNIVDNALKYSPSQLPVQVEAKADPSMLSILVTDQGCGIAVEEQSRIFDRFYRSSTLDYEMKGTGIGLSLVKRIIEDHGGRVRVTSRPGEGSIFTIELVLSGDVTE